MTTDEDDVGTYVGWSRSVADWKVRFGRWLDTKRNDDAGIYHGFATVADLKVRLGVWLEKQRRD